MDDLKKAIFILIILTMCSCSGINRFSAYDLKFISTLGIYNPKYDRECRKKDLKEHVKPYKNKSNPSRTCVAYRDYLCRINITCKGDKQCEEEAKRYWIVQDRIWSKKADPVEIVKNHCIMQRLKCDYSDKKGECYNSILLIPKDKVSEDDLKILNEYIEKIEQNK